MNRLDLQQLADDRVADAAALLAAGRWSCAYYVCGYAVECALKACIALQFQEHDLPEKALVQRTYTHDLVDLLELAGLKPRLQHDVALATHAGLRDNWQAAKDWNERSRYAQIAEAQARTLHQAITDPVNGVLPWIKQYW